MSALLRTEGLTKRFGGLTAVDDVDFTLQKGELRCVIGPNGAGKTTFFNLLSGGLEPTEGSIYLEDEDIVGQSPDEILERGVARSFQISQLFNGLTVMENIRLGLLGAEDDRSFLSFALSNIDDDEELKEEAYRIADQVNLAESADKTVDALAHGQKRNLEIGMVLSTGADVLLLDEPAAGLTTSETEGIMELITDITDECTVLLIEHDMDLVMGISDQITVLHNGRILAEGTAEAIQNNQTVKEVYLGD